MINNNTTCRESTEWDQPNENPKSERKWVMILGDSMIKHTNEWEIAKKLKQCFCEKLPRSNYPTYGWLHETPYIWAKPNHFVIHVGTNDMNSSKPPDTQNCKNHYWFSFRIEIWKSGVSISPIIVRVEF